jgi:putative transposase
MPWIFIPKCRRKALYRGLRQHLGGRCSDALPSRSKAGVEEGYLMADHVHMLLSIPPKNAVSSMVGYNKGKSATHLARVDGEHSQYYAGQHFLAAWQFRAPCGTRRRIDTGLHSQPGEGRTEVGSTEPVEVNTIVSCCQRRRLSRSTKLD